MIGVTLALLFCFSLLSVNPDGRRSGSASLLIGSPLGINTSWMIATRWGMAARSAHCRMLIAPVVFWAEHDVRRA